MHGQVESDVGLCDPLQCFIGEFKTTSNVLSAKFKGKPLSYIQVNTVIIRACHCYVHKTFKLNSICR
jgi:hypothetical protein